MTTIERRDLWWPGFVIGLLVVGIALRAGLILAGRLAVANSTDFINQLDLHETYLLWSLPVVAACGGLAVGLTPRRLGGNGWNAFVTALPPCLAIVGVRNQLTVSETAWQFVLVFGLSHLGWRLGRFLSTLGRRLAGKEPSL